MRKVIFAGMVANGLEWYDFALYVYSALIISKLFFPAGNETAHLLATLGIFAVGFVARPFGGVLFGVIGDKFGRRVALATAIFMMAIPTGMIGLLPTYAQIGLGAPFLLLVLRLMQGLSLGGAFSGSITFIVEHAPQHKRGLIGSATIASLAIGFLLGSLIASLVKAPLSDMQYETWGWRVPFLLGVPIGLIGFFIRNYCHESPTYEAAKASGHLSKKPMRDVLKNEMPHLLQAIGVYISVTMPFYLLSAYFITFTENSLGRSKEEVLWLGSMNMFIMLIVSPFSAMLSDRIGRRKVHVIGAVLFLLLSYPILTLLTMPGLGSIIAAQAAFATLVGFYVGPVPALLVEIFPTRVRYSGMALAYNVAATVFGGTTPMVCQWLINQTGTSHSIAFYVMFCAILSLIALYFYRDRHQESLA